MVEKNRLAENVDSRAGNLKTSDSLLKGKIAEELGELQPSDQSPRQSGTLGSANEVDKFNTLCDGVLTAHSMFDMYLTEILAIKDELQKYFLPTNLLVNLTLSCSKLYRSASDLSTPTNELVRMVRLYSAQWEAKSNVLKKLHEDYESKQRRLDIALKKLEMVGVASERIEKQKRIMNWEKIFSKVMSAKSHGHRWKFLISSLKEKVKSGEILSIPFPSNSTDEEQTDSKTETYVPRHHQRNVRSLRHQSLLRREARNSRTSRTNDEQVDNEAESEMSSSEEHLKEHGLGSRKKSTNEHETKQSFTSARFKSKYPFEREGEFPRRLRPERTESPTGVRRLNNSRATIPGRRFAPPRNTDGPSFGKKSVSFFDESSEEKPVAIAKEEKSVWTGEPQYNRFLHVRVYKPDCAKVSEPICTVCFGDQVFSGGIYGTGKENSELSASREKNDEKLSQVSAENEFQEFVFTLPEDKVYVKGKPVSNIESQQLRIAVQSGKAGQMIAMCTVEYSDLKILKTINENEDLADFSSPETRPLLSLLSDKETMFNSVVGHVPLVCYQHVAAIFRVTVIGLVCCRQRGLTRRRKFADDDHEDDSTLNQQLAAETSDLKSTKERFFSSDQSTQTSSIQELFDEMMEVKRMEEEDKNKLKANEPIKMYTENDFQEMKQKHDEELEWLRSEYELQLQEIARTSNKSSSPDLVSHLEVESKFVSASTSPIPMRSTSPLPSSPKVPQRPRTADARSSPRRGKKIKTDHVLPEWGKDLPVNFFDRLEQFSRASAKHHQELSEKTKKAVQENYELQMATQNRLNLTDDEIDLNDVCLPALFMPSRMGTVYSPKASLYFHPSGISKGRFTQPPSVFKLPSSVAADRSSVMNLFDLSQTFLTSGPRWLQNARPQSACSAGAQKDNFHVSTSLNALEPYTKLKSE